MRSWSVNLEQRTVVAGRRPVPEPAGDEVLVRVAACGVCRTDLHIIDGELADHRPGVVPGHQVVGTVARTGAGVRSLREGDLVGVAWLRRTCGSCRWCRSGRENLCPFSLYTGWDEDGGYADYVTVAESFAYLLPSDADPVLTAPLLCAGIIGYRALSRARLPAGGLLGIYGFGSSGHITGQLAVAGGARLAVMTRGEQNRALGRALGAEFVGDATDVPPEALDAAIVFAPAGELVPSALEATVAGGTVVIAGIHLSDLPPMAYARTLFHERDLRSVEANTRADGAALLRLAHNLRLAPTVTRYPFDRVDEALSDLRAGNIAGSAVIEVDSTP